MTKIWRPRVLVFAVVVAFCASSLTVLKGKVDNVAMFLVSLVVAYVGFLLVSIFSDVTERDEPESSSPLPPPCSMKPSVKDFAATYGWVADPGKQALEMLQRGENCDWYSIKHSDEQHEAFDCLEIYWRTNVECPEQNEFHYGRGPFELKAGFRVRWHVAGTHHSYVEAVGLDLMSTILDAREQADRLMARAKTAAAMGRKHPALEAWKARGDNRKYGFDGLDVEKWSVRLDYPGGLSWADAPELDQAVADALAKAPV